MFGGLKLPDNKENFQFPNFLQLLIQTIIKQAMFINKREQNAC